MADTVEADYLAHVTERHLRDWYRERDLLPGGLESVIGADSTLADTTDRVLHDTGLIDRS
ncbi:hypothetical protein [Streptomyces sp. NPDC096105]|uniref:hypothetical protein n=1 Tax=Streptomyces sp. NPDC096105 TaxID=3366074 RepID=UPI00382790F5